MAFRRRRSFKSRRKLTRRGSRRRRNYSARPQRIGIRM